MPQRTRYPVAVAAILLMIALGVVGTGLWRIMSSPPQPQAVAKAAEQFLRAAPPKDAPFQIQNIPPWLFTHVGIIAGLQVLSVLFAALRASREEIDRADRAIIQFLIEVPMYLGLFGTLLGVSLTQFITGTLVAPLAYLTTMSGILLYVFGRLSIALPLDVEGPTEE